MAASGKIYIKDMKPQDVDKLLRQAGYCGSDPHFLGRGLVVTTYAKTGSKDVKLYANALNFELFITLHEPPNYFI